MGNANWTMVPELSRLHLSTHLLGVLILSLIQYLPYALFIAGVALRLYLFSRDGVPVEATLFLRSAKNVVKNEKEPRQYVGDHYISFKRH